MKVSARRPRIGVFTKPLDNWNSGSGHHLDEMLSRVLDIAGDRFDFTFIHYAKSLNPIYSRARELLIPRNPLAAASLLRNEDFDLLHYGPLTVYSPIWGLRARKLATIHGVEQLLLPQFHGPMELAHERIIVPAYARRMDAIITVSETSARYFVEHFGIKPSNITVCYNGVGPAYRVLEPRRDEDYLASKGITGPFVFHISRFSERKNPWTLLEAFARFVALRQGNERYSLVCAGKGWDCEAVRARARALGIADRLVAPGFVDEGEVVRLMNAASVFAFPSLAEGFGMPNVEAMACGCPVVTTRAFAVGEIVGDAAIVVDDPHDAEGIARGLDSVVNEPEVRERLLSAAAKRLPLFSWENSAAKLLEVYGRLGAK